MALAHGVGELDVELVEHEPEDIWTSTVMVCREALEKAGLKAKDIAAIGITVVELGADWQNKFGSFERVEARQPLDLHAFLDGLLRLDELWVHEL